MEWIIPSGIAACIIYAAHKWEWNDKQTKIMLKTFDNIGYKKKDQLPKLFKKSDQENYTDYIFNVPYGLTDNEKLKPTLEKTLDKTVRIYFKQKLFVRVYKEVLPTEYDYDWKSTEGWTFPIGRNLDGMIYHDFDKIPHMTVAGMTRQGKTVFLKLVLAHLINNNANVEFNIIDLKGGLEFGKYERLKQVKEVSSNVKEAKNQLKKITDQMKKDMQHFKDRNINNIVNSNIKKRSFIIVDEAAELTDSKDCQKYLSEIARIGGALGYRLIFATQYPTADTLPRQIKQNSDAKISFRLPTEIASRVAIDEMGAEQLGCPGRAIYRTHERQLVQVPYIDDKEITERLRRFEVENRTKDQKAGKNIINFG